MWIDLNVFKLCKIKFLSSVNFTIFCILVEEKERFEEWSFLQYYILLLLTNVLGTLKYCVKLHFNTKYGIIKMSPISCWKQLSSYLSNVLYYSIYLGWGIAGTQEVFLGMHPRSAGRGFLVNQFVKSSTFSTCSIIHLIFR